LVLRFPALTASCSCSKTACVWHIAILPGPPERLPLLQECSCNGCPHDEVNLYNVHCVLKLLQSLHKVRRLLAKFCTCGAMLLSVLCSFQTGEEYHLQRDKTNTWIELGAASGLVCTPAACACRACSPRTSKAWSKRGPHGCHMGCHLCTQQTRSNHVHVLDPQGSSQHLQLPQQ